jgi:hypothetical protein
MRGVALDNYMYPPTTLQHIPNSSRLGRVRGEWLGLPPTKPMHIPTILFWAREEVRGEG